MKVRITMRQVSLILCVLLLCGGTLVGFGMGLNKGYSFPKPLETTDEGTTDLSEKAIHADETLTVDRKTKGRTNYRGKRIWIDETFVSNLPLVVLETENDKRPPAHIVWNSEEQQYFPNAEEEIYLNGTLSLYENSRGTNCLSDSPSLVSDIRLRRRGNSSVHYDKAQFLVKLLDEDGKSSRKNLLQMGADNEWVLNVSFIDKSLLRNYLAYTVAGEIMPYVPDCRFCEVIWKTEDGYQYEGVYLLMEKIKVGKNRVDLPAFAENSKNLPFLLRRDRWEPNRLLLNNYGRREELLEGVLRVEWPDATRLSDQSVQRITDQIDAFEQALFSDDYEEFIQYRDMIDVESFVDYLIINEFFINYDAGYHSTYIYSDYSGKLAMGPVWDFDGAIDNYHRNSAKLDTAAFFKAPWFRQLLRDPEMTVQIMERYRELRKSILSDQAICEFIDGTVAGLGSAIERDWARWGYFYADGKYLTSEVDCQSERNTKTHHEETEKLKQVLSEHGAWMDDNLDTLYQCVDPDSAFYRNVTENVDYHSAFAVIFIAVFLISVKLVLKYESE